MPPAGAPAALGFTVAHGPSFVLVARLRSDGDYGVSIGDAGSGRSEGRGLQALSLTLCGYGVVGEESVLAQASTAACAAPTPATESVPYEPDAVLGVPPSTTLRADTYQDPADYVSRSVYNGTNLAEGAPSATESFVTGCTTGTRIEL